MGMNLNENLWRLYVAPKGRLGNIAQGVALNILETARLKRRLNRTAHIILIHSQGKTGSTAMYEAMATSPLADNAVTLQTHVIRAADNPREKADRKGLAPRRTFYTTEMLYKVLSAPGFDGKRVTVVSAVRDPIERMISDFFQNLERYTPDRRYPAMGQYSAADYAKWFETEFDIFRSSDWFEEQFRDLFSLDLYATTFDQEKGFQIVRSDEVVGGIIRYDRIKDAASAYFLELLGADIELHRSNDSSAKVYADVYEDFKQRVRFDREALERLYEQEYVRHFYTGPERAAAVDRWSR